MAKQYVVRKEKDMSKKDLNYQELTHNMLEGLCRISYELFDCKIKHKELDIEDEVGMPLEFLKDMWVAKHISDMTDIDQEVLTEIAMENEEYE